VKMPDNEEENKSLKNDILEVIQALLDRPKMFAADVSALEGQFYNLITVVAPYAFQMTSREAGEKIVGYVALASDNKVALSYATDDIDVAASLLRKCYQENFECFTHSETVH